MLIAACDFMNIESTIGKSKGTFGLFSYQEPGTDECVEISDDIGDGWFKCAQVCSIIALCSGAILFGLGFFKQCIIPLPFTQPLMDLSSILTQVCLALVYFVWLSDACDTFRCTYGDGGTLLILTQIFWLGAGCFSRCMRPGRFERRDEIAANKKTKQEAKKRQEADDELKKREEEVAEKEAAMGDDDAEQGGDTDQGDQ
jgi:hypothetical protein